MSHVWRRCFRAAGERTVVAAALLLAATLMGVAVWPALSKAGL